MFKKKEQVYSISEFLNGDFEKIDKDRKNKRVLHALLFLNPFLTEEMATSQYNQIMTFVNNQPKQAYAPLNPPNPSNMGFFETVGSTVDSVETLVFYLTHPVEILKIIAGVTIDLSFTVAAIACIVSLAMYVFTGCKDMSSLKYCGLSLILYFVVVTVLTQFVALF